MKKTLLLFAAVLLMLSTLSSCNNNDDDRDIRYYAFATLRANSATDFYFEGDSGLVLRPTGNGISIDPKESGNRAIVYFRNLNQNGDKNYTFSLEGMRTIVTKNAISVLKQTQLDSVGDDPINPLMLHLSTDGKYLDCYIETANMGQNAEYMVSLIENTLVNHESGYVNLELHLLRKNAEEGNYGFVRDYVSFRLPDWLNPVDLKLNGVYLRVNTGDKIKYLKVTTKAWEVASEKEIK